jgi:hypothetical protein
MNTNVFSYVFEIGWRLGGSAGQASPELRRASISKRSPPEGSRVIQKVIKTIVFFCCVLIRCDLSRFHGSRNIVKTIHREHNVAKNIEFLCISFANCLKHMCFLAVLQHGAT